MVTNATEKGIGKQIVRAGRGSRCSVTSAEGGAITQHSFPVKRRRAKEKERIKEKDGVEKVIGTRVVKEIGVKAKEIGAKEENITAEKDGVKEMEQKEEANRERLRAKAKEKAK